MGWLRHLVSQRLPKGVDHRPDCQDWVENVLCRLNEANNMNFSDTSVITAGGSVTHFVDGRNSLFHTVDKARPAATTTQQRLPLSAYHEMVSPYSARPHRNLSRIH